MHDRSKASAAARCNRSAPPPLLLVVAAASGAFDLSVMLCHVLKCIGIASVSVDSKKSVYRYRLKMAYSV